MVRKNIESNVNLNLFSEVPLELSSYSSYVVAQYGCHLTSGPTISVDICAFYWQIVTLVTLSN